MKKKSLVVLLAVACITTFAQSAGATYSGRNGKIAYADKERINLVNADGTGHRAIGPTFGGFAEAPQVSSDGAWIVFDASQATGSVDIYVIRTDGTGFDRLTRTHSLNEWSPSWSPDGKHIVYSSNGSYSQIMVMKANGRGSHAVGSAFGEYARYSPNGKKIAYGNMNDNEVHVMNADGTDDHAVTSISGSDYPDWSPDGKQLTYTRANDIWVIDANGSGDTQITNTGGSRGVWSPDGKWIAYEEGSDLMKIKLGGGSPQLVRALVTDCCLGWQPT